MGDRYYPRGPYRDERSDGYDRNDRYPQHDDRYRRYDRYDHYERHPLPPRPRQAHDRDDRYNSYGNEYNFRGAADRDHTYRPQPPQSDFTFQARGPPAPRFPPQEQRRRSPAPPPQQAPPPRAKKSRRERLHDKQGQAVQHGERPPPQGPRGTFRRPPPAAHERDLLQRRHGGSTPEQLHGMNQDGQSRFMDVDFSSSDEQGSEDGEIEDDVSVGDGPRKRVKTDVSEPAEQAAPKWSNPEYFTALPPPEAGLAPKKDIVQVIRKAKVDAMPKPDTTTNAVKDNADFISFNMDDDMDDMTSSPIRSNYNSSDHVPMPPKNAPTGPSAAKENPQASAKTDTNEETPKKRPFKQFDPTGPPPKSPPNIDQLMNMAAGMHVDVTAKPDEPPPKPPSPSIDPLPGKASAMQNVVDAKPPRSRPAPRSLKEIAEAQMGDRYVPPPAQPAPQQSSEPKGKKRKAAEISRGLGSVVPEWLPNETNPTPWCTVDHTRTANVGLRLHKEIADFYEFVRPHDYEEAVRRNLIKRVQQNIPFPDSKNVEIRSFGSFASGLYLPTADMDLVAVSREYLQRGQKVYCRSSTKMWKLINHLIKAGVALDKTHTVIGKAKVPIIKYTDKQTGIKVDISFENDTGLIANRTFAEWKEKYPAMPVIVVLIKQMLAMRGLNEVFHGGLGGFSIICLVVSMMQHMPEIQSGNMDPQLHYGELLLNFLDLYGNKFSLPNTGIIMNPPGYFDKIRNPHKKQNHSGLTIIDPNKPDNDISGGSHRVDRVFEVFRIAHAEIQRRLAQIYSGENIEDSILGVIWGGNYTSFIHQRNKLSLLHRGQAVSPPPVPEPKQPRQPKQPKKKFQKSKGPQESEDSDVASDMPRRTRKPKTDKKAQDSKKPNQGAFAGPGRRLRSENPPVPVPSHGPPAGNRAQHPLPQRPNAIRPPNGSTMTRRGR